MKNLLINFLKLIARMGLIVINDGFLCLPVKKGTAVFESFNGGSVGDNPLALYREWLIEHPEDERKLYFSVKPKMYQAMHQAFPEIQLVRRFTLPWVLIMARANYWVFNSRMPAWWHKNRGTVYLQTWHGTPLKKLARDIDHVEIPGQTTAGYHDAFKQEAARWDYLIAPNAYSAEIFTSAFAFSNTMLKTGYPRNDRLIQDNHPDQIANLKAHYFGQTDLTIVTYAPTWRDDDAVKTGQYRFQLPFDLAEFFATVGDQVRLILRPHYLVKDHIDLQGFEDRVLILADEPIDDLYLMSDLLITDYSSVMFDYANLKRPMIFYAADIDHYRDELRGFYFDYEAEIPGPLATNQQELTTALNDWRLDSKLSAYSTRQVAFYDKFCQWETGHASQQVLEQITGGSHHDF